jgi:hypothetical protein
VILWSREPWRDVTRGKELGFPAGRLVAGTTGTPIGHLRFVGVCVPWRDAHVRTGRRDRNQWEDHVAYLDALQQLLSGSTRRTIVVGDFNQRVPRMRQPVPVFELLGRCLGSQFEIATAGLRDGAGNDAIDHLALTSDLAAGPATILPAVALNGLRMSDHFGFSVAISARDPKGSNTV